MKFNEHIKEFYRSCGFAAKDDYITETGSLEG